MTKEMDNRIYNDYLNESLTNLRAAMVSMQEDEYVKDGGRMY